MHIRTTFEYNSIFSSYTEFNFYPLVLYKLLYIKG
ncbi:hypothetical protein UGMREWDR_CDS0118 [Aeromonas phage GomatiRiver_11]|nr:hypothetical protein UGMREWDR_CDS0118 [Aeromonas phage GomatiRiver_11]